VGLISNRVGLISNRMGLLLNRVGLFLGERVLKNMPSLLFEQPLKFIGHGAFSRAYVTSSHVMSCRIAILLHIDIL